MTFDIATVNKMLLNDPGGVRTVVDGIEFRSRLEAMWWTELVKLKDWLVYYEPGTLKWRKSADSLMYNYTPDFALLHKSNEPSQREGLRRWRMFREKAIFIETKPEQVSNENIPNNIWLAGDIILIQGYPDSSFNIDVIQTGGSKAHWRWPRVECGIGLGKAITLVKESGGAGRASFGEKISY